MRSPSESGLNNLVVKIVDRLNDKKLPITVLSSQKPSTQEWRDSGNFKFISLGMVGETGLGKISYRNHFRVQFLKTLSKPFRRGHHTQDLLMIMFTKPCHLYSRTMTIYRFQKALYTGVEF